MSNFVKLGPTYINLDLVAAINSEEMSVSFLGGAGLEDINFSYEDFEDEEEFDKEVERLIMNKQFN